MWRGRENARRNRCCFTFFPSNINLLRWMFVEDSNKIKLALDREKEVACKRVELLGHFKVSISLCTTQKQQTSLIISGFQNLFTSSYEISVLLSLRNIFMWLFFRYDLFLSKFLNRMQILCKNIVLRLKRLNNKLS